MKEMFARILYTDFDIHNIYVYDMRFLSDAQVNYLDTGRRMHLLYWLRAGSRVYETEKKSLLAHRDALLFIPEGTRYRSRAIAENDGIGICFDADIAIPPGIYTTECLHAYQTAFLEMQWAYTSTPIASVQLKALLYNLFCLLGGAFDLQHNSLYAALELLRARYCENIPVSEYAKACNMSESCFRKKFSLQFGLSPIAFRNRLRFAEAKRLYQTGKSMDEIAECLGFCDRTYLARLYKRELGISLKRDAENI